MWPMLHYQIVFRLDCFSFGQAKEFKLMLHTPAVLLHMLENFLVKYNNSFLLVIFIQADAVGLIAVDMPQNFHPVRFLQLADLRRITRTLGKNGLCQVANVNILSLI